MNKYTAEQVKEVADDMLCGAITSDQVLAAKMLTYYAASLRWKRFWLGFVGWVLLAVDLDYIGIKLLIWWGTHHAL